jgi:aminoglycoside phosphotransferase (APT) family kinase protein
VPIRKMHTDEVDTDVDLVKWLIAAQYPQWADRPVREVDSAGTDNAIYRLGDDMAVRLPRIRGAVGQAEKDLRWLPRFAPLLPLDIPVPLAIGTPAGDYPWTWSVYRWLHGESAPIERVDDPGQAATALAGFLTALQGIDVAGGPTPVKRGRGGPLAPRDADVRAAIDALSRLRDDDLTIDAGAATAAWEAALRAPSSSAPPTWIHCDLHAGNLLVHDGRLSAVIDFAGLTVGDPAVDLMVAWTFLSAAGRAVFRAALAVDDATWARGRGWALSVGLIALPYYFETNPAFARIARHAIDEVLLDHAG